MTKQNDVIRILLNDSDGRYVTDEIIEPLLEIANTMLPLLVAALFAAAKGNLELTDNYLRFLGAGIKRLHDSPIPTAGPRNDQKAAQ